MGLTSYVSGSTSIITNLTASNISASGRIIASVISSSNAYFSDIGFTNQTVAPDTSVFPTGSTYDGLILDGGTYTNGLYRTRFVKVDRSSNLPLYIQETTSTSGSFRNLARFGTHANSPNTFEVFGSTNIQGAITSSNFVGPHIGNTTGTSSWSTNALTASSLVAANSYAVNNFTASNISCSGYLQSAAAVYQQITSSTFDSASYSNQWVRIAKFDFNIPGTIPFGGFFDEFALKIIANPVSGMQPYSDRFVSPSVALTGSNRGNYANLLISNASYAATPSINVLNAYTYGTALVTKIRSAKDAGNSTWYVDAFITNQSASAVDLMRVEIDSGRGQLQWQLNPSTASYTSNVEFDITIPGVKNANSYVYNFDGNVTSSGNILVGGRVGIGTTSPTQKLDIVGSYAAAGDSSGILKIRGGATGTDTQLNFGVSADNGYGWIQATDVGLTNNINIILNPLGGNIGIGTTNPVARLQVAGNISGSSFTSSISNAVGFLGTSSWAQNVVNFFAKGASAVGKFIGELGKGITKFFSKTVTQGSKKVVAKGVKTVLSKAASLSPKIDAYLLTASGKNLSSKLSIQTVNAVKKELTSTIKDYTEEQALAYIDKKYGKLYGDVIRFAKTAKDIKKSGVDIVKNTKNWNKAGQNLKAGYNTGDWAATHYKDVVSNTQKLVKNTAKANELGGQVKSEV